MTNDERRFLFCVRVLREGVFRGDVESVRMPRTIKAWIEKKFVPFCADGTANSGEIHLRGWIGSFAT